MATYRQIQEDVRVHSGQAVKTCWIAHVKELNGLPRKDAPNRISSTFRKFPCPVHIRPMIEESMRRFGMLPHTAV